MLVAAARCRSCGQAYYGLTCPECRIPKKGKLLTQWSSGHAPNRAENPYISFETAATQLGKTLTIPGLVILPGGTLVVHVAWLFNAPTNGIFSTIWNGNAMDEFGTGGSPAGTFAEANYTHYSALGGTGSLVISATSNDCLEVSAIATHVTGLQSNVQDVHNESTNSLPPQQPQAVLANPMDTAPAILMISCLVEDGRIPDGVWDESVRIGTSIRATSTSAFSGLTGGLLTSASRVVPVKNVGFNYVTVKNYGLVPYVDGVPWNTSIGSLRLA